MSALLRRNLTVSTAVGCIGDMMVVEEMMMGEMMVGEMKTLNNPSKKPNLPKTPKIYKKKTKRTSFYDENRHRQGCFWIVPGSLHPPLPPHHPPSLVYPCGGLVEREDFEGGWWWRMMVEVAC